MPDKTQKLGMSTEITPQEVRNSLVAAATSALAARYDGWRRDYIGTVEPFPALEPAVMNSGRQCLEQLDHPSEILQSQPDLYVLQKLAKILSASHCMCWSAHDPVTHTIWDPLLHSYQEFKTQHPEAEPYLASPKTESALEQQLVGFFLQLEHDHGK
jgi:hypothetical protein